ncbi:olfactory receptor 2AT4-like [Pleurodeles waltl]|uniref:olfactory receptor 2AT4-like n=1 Tax=Pleurodeles waltl TaxID=8319 RepID=UPI00370988B2
MEDHNQSSAAKDFILVGFPSLQNLQTALFLVFLLSYLVVLSGNLMILCAVVLDQKLHKPMYFLLSNLSVIDILCTTTIVPKMLAMFLFNAKAISFHGCFIQMYFFHSLAGSECFLLVTMAYDRYVAICIPLHYTTKMTNMVNIYLAASVWIIALLLPLPAVIQTSQLRFCSPYKVMHCFCEHLSVVQAACSDTTSQASMGSSLAMVVSTFPLLLVSLSYLNIIRAILKISSKEGRQKAFSTCTSHLIVVITYYTSIGVSYISYKADMAIDFHVMGNVIYAILTPMVNPMIYTLRNKEMKDAIAKLLHIERKQEAR